MVTIYKMDCLANGKSYIGITSNFEKRIAKHWNAAKNGVRSILCNTIRKYGKENFIAVKIDCVETWDEACERERQHIRFFETKEPHGMNMTDGGDGANGLIRSKEARYKVSGEKSNFAKIAEFNVIDIRRQYKDGISPKELAEKYGIGQSQISRIITGKVWTHVQKGMLSSSEIKEIKSESCKNIYAGEKNGFAKLMKEDVISIRKQYEDGVSPKQLAGEYKIAQGTISRIVRRKRWQHI